jgi:hypothetical protein
MSDTTKKSIVINKSFLSGSDNSGTTSTIQNKKSRKNARILSEEIIRPNKLKKMLLDKINAKRKAEYGSYNNGSYGNNSVTSAGISVTSKGNGILEKENSLDITKESKLFSNEFKKSLDFLDSYIGQRVNSSNYKKNKNKTLKSQPTLTPQTSLHTDIIKSVHSNNNQYQQRPQQLQRSQQLQQPQQYQQSLNHVLQPPNNNHQSIQTPLYNTQPHHAPHFQKIQLNIPSKNTQNITPNIFPKTLPKINLSIGNAAKMEDQTVVYTELPPELQNYTPLYTPSQPSLPLSLSSTMSLDTLPQLEPYTNYEIDMPTDHIDSREMDKIEDININSETSLFPTSTTFSPLKLSDDTPYGCLKGGKKPTFRTYNKTIKNISTNLNKENQNDTDAVYSDRQSKLRELQNKHTNNKHNNVSTSKHSKSSSKDNDDNNDGESDDDNHDGDKRNHDLRKTKIRRHLRKTITKKFKLGKQSGNIVGVLIKNNDTRKNVQKEHGLLKSKQLADIKKILVEKNLIKIGSTAPPGIIRNIYEASMLTGDVDNIGKGIGLHNFLEDKKSW